MTPDRKEHWTVKVFRLGSTGALLLSQAGCRGIGEVTPPSEGTQTPIAETVPPNENWIDKLLKSLGQDYYRKLPSAIWFDNPNSNIEYPVLMELTPTMVAFQFSVRGEKKESGRENVRFVTSNHLYVFSDSTLVAVSNYDNRVFTFDEVSNKWMEDLGYEVIARYETCPDGSKKIMVWRNDENGQTSEIYSEYRIDSSGALVHDP